MKAHDQLDTFRSIARAVLVAVLTFLGLLAGRWAADSATASRDMLDPAERRIGSAVLEVHAQHGKPPDRVVSEDGVSEICHEKGW